MINYCLLLCFIIVIACCLGVVYYRWWSISRFIKEKTSLFKLSKMASSTTDQCKRNGMYLKYI